MKIKFTEKELEAKGFSRVTDGNEVYFEFIFSPEDYFNSKFMATESVEEEDYLNSMLELSEPLEFGIVNSLEPDNGEPFFTEAQIDDFIKKGGF